MTPNAPATPRTDAHALPVEVFETGTKVVAAYIARQLERDLTAAKEALTRLLMWPLRSTEAAAEQDVEFAKKVLSHLTPKEPTDG